MLSDYTLTVIGSSYKNPVLHVLQTRSRMWHGPGTESLPYMENIQRLQGNCDI